MQPPSPLDPERVKAVGYVVAEALGRGEGGRVTRAHLRSDQHFLERHNAQEKKAGS